EEEIQEHIASFNEDIKQEQAEEQTSITSDIELLPNIIVPEFCADFISESQQKKFKDATRTLYHYYSSKGIPVGCVVRYDMEKGDDHYKTFHQYSYKPAKGKWTSGWSGDGKPLYNLQEI